MSPRTWIALGAFSGALTVGLGAFGAHALKESVPPADLDIWNTAVHYQGLHALALILFGLFAERRRAGGLTGWGFLLGTAIFSGTLYGIVLGGPRWLGAITPLGGTAMIVGWIAFGVAALRSNQRS
jgi:uncharacterized membrane protein YgdD (TMEM256/DUF423 family)